MKKAITVILIGFVLSTSAIHAEANPVKKCGQITILAEKIMELRQKGVKQRKLVNAFTDVEYGYLIIEIIKSAYTKPRYDSDEYINKAITDFSNDIFGMCLEEVE